MKSPIQSLAIIVTLAIGALNAVYADSATWSASPISNDWNTAANWTPNTVPNGPDDVATFGLSHHPGVFVSTDTEVNEVIFNAGASAFTINANGGYILTISGVGITNNSGIAQNFVATTESGFNLTNNAIVGDMTFFTLKGGHGQKNAGGFAGFSGNASAGNGTFVLEPVETPDAYRGGGVFFSGNASAANGTFTVQSTSLMDFSDNSTAGNGTFVVEGGLILFESFSGITTAGSGLFIINSGSVDFWNDSSAGNATLIANPGSNGGEGGRISFENDTDDGGEARIEVFGNGTLDIQFIFGQFVSVGSIEGDGIVVLGTKELITGSNDLSTTFSGTIQDSDIPRHPGSLQKIGNGTLTLAGDGNTYTGATTVEGGKLIVANQSGSATGSGSVSVTRGKLGGTGIIAGATTIGTGSGTGAFLVPSIGQFGGQLPLTIQSALTFNADATYSCTFKAEQHGDTTRTKTSMVIANGVTINSEATIDLIGHITGALSQGTVLTLINNTQLIPSAAHSPT
jgi:autotransporter-associated beta strand protein